MKKIKLGWKRNLIKVSHLVGAFFVGLFLWGVIASLLNIEPNKIAFVPIAIIAVAYALLAMVHRKKDQEIMVEILSKQTGIDVGVVVDEIKKEQSEEKDKSENSKVKK